VLEGVEIELTRLDTQSIRSPFGDEPVGAEQTA
jgi:hypothetical protein